MEEEVKKKLVEESEAKFKKKSIVEEKKNHLDLKNQQRLFIVMSCCSKGKKFLSCIMVVNTYYVARVMAN